MILLNKLFATYIYIDITRQSTTKKKNNVVVVNHPYLLRSIALLCPLETEPSHQERVDCKQSLCLLILVMLCFGGGLILLCRYKLSALEEGARE